MKKESIGQRLLFLRNNFGLTQTGISQSELARLTGFNVSAISHFERDRRTPSIPNAIRLCKALGCSMDWLTRGIRNGNE